MRRPEGEHFKKSTSEVRQTYAKLKRAVKRFGKVDVSSVKTTIHFNRAYAFGGVTVRRDHLRVGFVSTGKIRDRRIIRSMPMNQSRYGNSVRLSAPSHVDRKLIGWLRAAYELAGDKHV